MNKQNIKISIFGKSYLIAADESSQEIVQAAKMVDNLMNQAAEKTSAKAEQIAVLVSLQLAADLRKVQQSLKNVETKTTKLTRLLDELL
jgi:cell division protein ZapA (FtsZ GTPase activity inhibitor)